MLVKPLDNPTAKALIVANHYSGRTSNMMFAFGLYDDLGTLQGAVTYGLPASPQTARSILPDTPELVLELNRLVITTMEKNAASYLVGRSLRQLEGPKVVVSYADRGQRHVGFVYQATNFRFGGESTPHDSEYLIDGKRVHPRTLAARGITSPKQWAKENGIESVPVEPKYRYVYFVGSKREVKDLSGRVKWDLTQPYPKGDMPRRNGPPRYQPQEERCHPKD